MNKERRNRLMFRWSLVTAGAIALFWGIWYLIAGSVPTPSDAGWFGWKPPLISRWWDILIGPIWSIAMIWTLRPTPEKDEKSIWLETFLTGLLFGQFGGLVGGLVAGLLQGLICGLACTLGATLFLWLTILIYFLFSGQTWKTIGKWLMAK